MSAVLCADGDIRLQGGTNEREGRIEICNDETWGTVCDRAFGVPDGNVACRQLGFAPIGRYHLSLTIFLNVKFVVIYC